MRADGEHHNRRRDAGAVVERHGTLGRQHGRFVLVAGLSRRRRHQSSQRRHDDDGRRMRVSNHDHDHDYHHHDHDAATAHHDVAASATADHDHDHDHDDHDAATAHHDHDARARSHPLEPAPDVRAVPIGHD
jgi:hypothetical protein